MFGIRNDSSNRSLCIIDEESGDYTIVGVTNFHCKGMAFHPDGRLFAVNLDNRQLVELDKLTGAVLNALPPYDVGSGTIEGLAFHPDGTLYGVDVTLGDLLTLDLTTGQVTRIGSFGIPPYGMAGLSWNLDGTRLYGIHWYDGCLYDIAPSTGTATLIGCGDILEPLGLATDPLHGQLYTVEWHTGDDMTLARVDADTGLRTVGGTTVGAYQFEGISFDPATIFETYCSATHNSTGSPAAISAVGSTSISSDNLVLRAGPVPNQLGLFMHGNDQVQFPFGDGFLCVSGGIVRLGPPTLASALVATRTVSVPTEVGVLGSRHFQYWFRDPAGMGSAFNTSNALTIVFVP